MNNRNNYTRQSHGNLQYRADAPKRPPQSPSARTPENTGNAFIRDTSRARIERAKARERRRRRRRIINITTMFVLFAVLILIIAVIAKIISGDSEPSVKPDGNTALPSQTDTTEKTDTVTDAVTEPLTGPAAYGITFVSDLSEYEQYMDPENRNDYMIVVNKGSLLDENYKPDDLADLTDTRADGRETQRMRLAAAKAIEAMFIEMRASGYTDVSITSAYRPYSQQKYLFEKYTADELKSHPGWTLEQAEAEVETYSARPGTSEHQTGLCCDLHNLPSADKRFANEEAYTWLCDNAWKFGFILRYPEDKTSTTGYDFEPWHYRFVGRYNAQKIREQGLCLEEYAAQQNQVTN